MNKLTTMSILLVEDDPMQQLLTLTALDRIGIKNHFVANNGQEAWGILLKNYVHLVITDKDMPVMDGLELVVKIRKTPIVRHLKVIMLSGDLTESASPSSQEQHLRDFLKRKNVTPLPKTSLNSDSLRHVILSVLN